MVAGGKQSFILHTWVACYLRLLLLAALVAGVLIADTWATYSGLVVVRGTESDFYFVWRGVREIAFGRDPYTDAIAAQIQVGILGHLASPTGREYHFAYPGFVVFLVFPLAALPFLEAVTLWLMAQQLLLGAGLMLTLRAMNWTVSKPGLALLIVAWGIFRYTLITLVLAQTSILVLFLLVGAAYLSSHGRDNLAGVVLGLAMFKPQVVVLPVAGWLVAKLVTRQFRAIGVYGASVAALMLLLFAVIGNWIPGFARVLILYREHNAFLTPISLAASLVPGAEVVAIALGTVLTVLYLVLMAVRRPDALAVISLGTLCTLMVFPLSSVYDIVLMLLPWVFCLRQVMRMHRVDAHILALVLASMPVVSWLLITLVPSLCESFNLPFDAVMLDKLVMPVLMFFIFAYAERQAPPLVPRLRD